MNCYSDITCDVKNDEGKVNSPEEIPFCCDEGRSRSYRVAFNDQCLQCPPSKVPNSPNTVCRTKITPYDWFLVLKDIMSCLVMSFVLIHCLLALFDSIVKYLANSVTLAS